MTRKAVMTASMVSLLIIAGCGEAKKKTIAP